MNAMTQSLTLLIGRVLVGSLFLVAGIRHFMFYAGSVGYFTKLGFPAPEAMVWLSIIIHIVGGILLIVGWRTQWASWVLLALVVIATAMAHRFWQFDAAQYVNQLNHFLKNLAIIGGLLYVITFGAGAMSADGRKRGGGSA
ncbi:MAG TPA: DoxX family protein [Burkholderiales bacterium]